MHINKVYIKCISNVYRMPAYICLLGNSLRECESCSDVDEILIVEFVVLSKGVHVSSDLRGAGSFYSQCKIRRKNGLITGIVQYCSSFHFSIQPDIWHFVLPELDWHLKLTTPFHITNPMINLLYVNILQCFSTT